MQAYLPSACPKLHALASGPAVEVQRYHHHTVTRPILVPAVSEPLVVLILGGTARVEERTLSGAWDAYDVRVGDFFLTQSTEPYEMRWRTGTEGFDVMHAYVSLALLEQARASLWGGTRQVVALEEVSGGHDETLRSLMLLLLSELNPANTPNPLYLWGVGQALSVHLLRTYAIDAAGYRPQRLPAHRLKKAIRWMDKHLAGSFDLDAIALDAGLSPFHFSRCFKQSTGTSPLQYFLRLKMERAGHLLRTSSAPITEIALDLGYASPAHFAARFKRTMGTTPSAYRHSS